MPTARRALSFRLPPDLIEQLQAVAQMKDRTTTWVVERAIEEYCRRELRPTKKEAA